MSQQSKRDNLGFIILIAITILGFILGTLFLIKYTNSKKEDAKPSYEFKDMSLKFNKVSNANTIDVFKDYPINPIEVKTDDKVSISGLKNSDVENKVNEVLSQLKVSKNNYCHVRANVSNILSVECGNGTGKTVSLVDGHEVTLEEIFNDDTNLKKIILDNIYDNLCNYQFSCWLGATTNENEEDFDAQIIKYINEIRKRDYSLVFSGYHIYLNFNFPDLEEEENYWSMEDSIYIPLYNVLDEVTIMDRFLTNENIYQKEVSTCSFPKCINYSYLNNSVERTYINSSRYLNDKVYLNMTLDNTTGTELFYEGNLNRKDLNLEKLLPKIEEVAIKEFNLEHHDYYKHADLNAYIFAYKENMYQIELFLNAKEMDLENFKVFEAGGFNERVKVLKNKNYFSINYFIDDAGNIKEGKNSLEEYDDAHEKILNYLWDRREVDENIKNYMCINNEDLVECSKSDFRNIVENAAYYIDEEKGIIELLYYGMVEGYGIVNSLKVKVPMTIFSEI